MLRARCDVGGTRHGSKDGCSGVAEPDTGGVEERVFVRLGFRAFRSGVRRSYCGYESKNLCARRGVLVPLVTPLSNRTRSIDSGVA